MHYWRMTPLPEFLTTQEVAALFRVDDSTVSKWAEAGRIPSVKTPGGRERRYPKAEILALATGEQVDTGSAGAA